MMRRPRRDGPKNHMYVELVVAVRGALLCGLLCGRAVCARERTASMVARAAARQPRSPFFGSVSACKHGLLSALTYAHILVLAT